MLHPCLRSERRSENRCITIPLTDSPLDRRSSVGKVAACNDDDISARQSFHRLTKPAQRKNVTASEWIQSVDQYDIDVARQTHVLESIIEHQNLHSELPPQKHSGVPAAGPDSHRRQS